MIPTCDRNYKDVNTTERKIFIDMVFDRPIFQDERDDLMTEHDGIYS